MATARAWTAKNTASLLLAVCVLCKSIFGKLLHLLRVDNSREVTVRRRFIAADKKLKVTLVTAIFLAKMILYMS
jgi:hypothetical protein